ncbi:MAG: DNA-directed RNA polymerase subunit beta' [Candidatus Pacebacteria bacterium]|jgi:DNA-directed RNA polymerase subunit beta'|nr:DNA-directed RNA polymerase subunit beta' [Candidatus Paceibacterota bacterium]
MKTLDTTNFDYITLKMASPDRIREWSYGEVTKPETINYRTGRSERGGLFDERVFGPEKDYECYCGKYKRIRYAGIICEKCGVEICPAVVRRERMGHIELASPVAHIWFLRGVPSRMSILTGIPVTDLEKVIYFAGYIITKVYEDEKATVLKDVETEFKTKMKTANDEETKERLKELLLNIKKEIGEIHEGKVLNEISYHHYSLKYGTCFDAQIGAEAIFNLFKNIDLKKLLEKCEERVEKASSVEREKLQKRIGLVRSMHTANLRPEWMFMVAIPVIPPALRPMVALEGGRHATSDVNDLYRRVINRNNRLKKLKEIGAPDVILRNEKRILQEAVDALFDNSITSQGDSQAMSQSQRRALKSLSDNLKSKQGLFRQNLLGKRVDYSGRSVIVIGPQLALDQCGLPKHMALELFRPFVIAKLIKYEHAHNTKGANRLIEEGVPEVWAILEEVIEGKYVLLNRAPTLHRLGIQAFHPILIEGNAIQVHPLVCSAYNADFDGDQMAVYVPLSDEAQKEAHDLMASNKNLLKPQNGDPIVSVKLLDIALGCYWMTKSVDGEKGEGKYFASPNQAIIAYEFGEISFRSKIKVLGTEKEKYAAYGGKPFETSVGRLLFNSILPADMPFLNEEMPQKRISALVDEVIYRYGIDATPPILDKIKNFGYKFITKAGITWGIDNVKVPEGKKAIIERGRKMEEEVFSQFNDGLLSQDEKYRKVIEIWDGIKIEVEKLLPATLEKNGSVEDMLRSGARGSVSNLTQMAGMKGLIVNTAGRTIDFPIVPSYKEGLSPIEYFITTHGARKGLADTALNTARAGYLTRRLVVAAQDVRITEEDCGTKEGRIAREDTIAGIVIPLSKNIRGRVLAADLKDESGAVLYKAGTLITKEDAVKIQEIGVKEAMVRSPLTCKTVYGLCQMCYGLDLGRNHLVDQGEAVGIIAAQAIGEPGTQLTLRTFHAGGVAGVDITQGLPRIEEIFERRRPHRALAVVSETNGEVMEIRPNGKEKVIVVLSDEKVGKTNTIEYTAGVHRSILVKVGEKIIPGQILTDGSADIADIFNYGGKDQAEKYIIDEIMKVYELQGASISKKHIEIIIRQMFSRRKIKQPGDTTFSPGEVVENIELVEENRKMKEAGLEEAKGDMIVLGITEASLNTQSWLAAASFQNTNRVLIANAVKGGEDRLRGLMENVIIGRLIPAGTGFKGKTESKKK